MNRISMTIFFIQAKENLMTECSTLQDGANTFETYTKEATKYLGKTWLLGCPSPCLQLHYSYSLSHFHKNSWVQPLNPDSQEFIDNHYCIMMAYGSMNIEKKEETLIYDSANFLAAVGGNLGLFLGFSCLSIVFAGIDFLAMKLGK